MIRYKKERKEIVEMDSKDLLEQYIKLYRRELPKNFGVALDRVSTTFFEFSSLDNPEDTVRLPYSILSSGVVEVDMTPLGGRNAAPMTLRAASGNRWDMYENIKYLGRALKSHFAENKKEESRRYESRTTDVWKEIVAKIKKDARARKLVIADSKLNSLTLADKNDPDKDKYQDDTWRLAVKVGYQPDNSIMQCDYDVDFNLPYNPDNGDVCDDCEYCIYETTNFEALAKDINQNASWVIKHWKELGHE
jgi:hypothetical protein